MHLSSDDYQETIIATLPLATILAIGSAALLAACTPYSFLVRDNPPTHEIHCDLGGHTRGDCYVEARRLCPDGFRELTTDADVFWSRRGELMFDRFYVGKPVRRVLTVSCEKPPTTAALPAGARPAPSGSTASGPAVAAPYEVPPGALPRTEPRPPVGTPAK